jgi:ketosteroid isomerase-like protein
MNTNSLTLLVLAASIVQLPTRVLATEASKQDLPIIETADAYRKAVLAADAAAVAATYQIDAVEMAPCRPMLKGRAAIEQYYRDLFQSPVKITSFTFSRLEVNAVGDIGYVVGTYRRTLSGGTAAPIDDSGKFLVLVKRTGDAWKSAYVIYNSDHPPVTPGSAAVSLPSPPDDLARLISYCADVADEWLVRLGMLALAAVIFAMIAFLVDVIRVRTASIGAFETQRLERLRKAQQNRLRVIARDYCSELDVLTACRPKVRQLPVSEMWI